MTTFTHADSHHRMTFVTVPAFALERAGNIFAFAVFAAHTVHNTAFVDI